MAGLSQKLCVIMLVLQVAVPAFSQSFDVTNNFQDDVKENVFDEVGQDLSHQGSESSEERDNFGTLESFNRPVGTVAVQAPTYNTGTFESFNRPEGTVAVEVPALNTVGITSGTYGSYRKKQGWLQAVSNDVSRHRVLHGNTVKQTKPTYPWMFGNLHRPSLYGFGLNGFWNSYAPTLPGGLKINTLPNAGNTIQ